METKIPFNIAATKQGATAMIRITGSIGWQTNAEIFRNEVDKLISGGVRDAHVYINTPGGSVFDANEIVNIISKFPGRVTGEGGALVASAGSYIAVHCHTFSMPSNGQFMIHKPTGITKGKTSEIETYLKLMRDIEKLYFEAYMAKAKNKADFINKWDLGDYWMTAVEAKQAGFITEVNQVVNIDNETVAMFASCNCPNVPLSLPTPKQPENKQTGLKAAIAALLDLQDNITEAGLVRHIAALKKDVADVKTTLLEDAYKAGRITETEKGIYSKLPVSSIHYIIMGSIENRDWTFDHWQKQNPEGLAEMRKNEPQRFQTLLDEHVNKLKIR